MTVAQYARPGGEVAKFFARWRYLKSDRQDVAKAVLNELIDAYEISLQDQMRSLGRDPSSVELKNKGVLRHLRAEANRYAVSMHRTYNRRLLSTLNALAAAGTLTDPPLKKWFNEYMDRAALSVATTTEVSGYHQGTRGFLSRNKRHLRGRAVIGPSYAGEPRCEALLARNPYTLTEIRNVSLPLHVGCIHTASAVYDPVPADTPLWVGG